jgi:hypothetical protein
MKRTLIALLAATVALLPLSAGGIEAKVYSDLVNGIVGLGGPVVSGRYVVFTASGKARYTAVAFEHENYTELHSFKRLVRKDETGKEKEDVLFYIAEVPPECRQLNYRMVIDGLWTTDPQNKSEAYDYRNGMMVSTLPVDYYEVFKTSNVSNDRVRFAWTGASGKSITLAGTFNNWDPFMYDLTETSPGKYELVLPLPAGTWYYAYFEGTSQLTDYTNDDRVYTKDGRVASVITVK